MDLFGSTGIWNKLAAVARATALCARSLRLSCRCLLLAGAVAGALPAQNSILQQLNPLAPTDGIRFSNISVFSSYYTGGIPIGLSALLAGPRKADVYSGAAATVGWSRTGRKWGASVVYLPSYLHNALNAPVRTLNHNGAVNLNAKLAKKWMFTASGRFMISSLEQLMFTPTVYGTVAATPATFDDLAAAILKGNSSNFQLATLVSEAPALTSPEQAFAYGRRVRSTSVQTGLSYAWSERSSLVFSVADTRMQHLQMDASAQGNPDGYLIPQTTSQKASITWGHSLSPRTQLAVTGDATRLFSAFQQAYTGETLVSIGRTMSRRWFAHGRFGAASMFHVRNSSAGPRRPQMTGGGGLGFKTLAHTFVGSVNRTIGDPYGLGRHSTTSAAGSWNWSRPGRSWSVYATAGQQWMRGLGQQQSWMATVGAARSLGAQFIVSLQYMYLHYPFYAPVAKDYPSQQGARISLTWIPFGR